MYTYITESTEIWRITRYSIGKDRKSHTSYNKYDVIPGRVLQTAASKSIPSQDYATLRRTENTVLNGYFYTLTPQISLYNTRTYTLEEIDQTIDANTSAVVDECPGRHR